MGCKSLKSAKLNHGLEYIGAMAFKKNISLKEVNIPNTVKTIGPFGFLGCRNLESVILSEGITEIGQGAFAGTNLKLVIIPSTVESVKEGMFPETCKLNFSSKR